MLNRTPLILAAIAAVAGAIVFANALVRVRADETLVVYTAEEPVVVASDGSFFGWSLRRPFSDYALVTQRVLQAKYDSLSTASNDGRSCELKNLAILYRFADPVEAATAERSNRKRHRISASRAFEYQFGIALVGELEVLPAERIHAMLASKKLPDSSVLDRVALGYGAGILSVSDAPRIVCSGALIPESAQEAATAPVDRFRSATTTLKDLAVPREDYDKIVSGERYARQELAAILRAYDFTVDEKRTGCPSRPEAGCKASNAQTTEALAILSALRSGQYRLVAPVAYSEWFPINGGPNAVCAGLKTALSNASHDGAFDDVTNSFRPDQHGSMEGLYYFWISGAGAKSVAVVSKGNKITSNPYDNLRYVAMDISSCEQLLQGQVNSWKKASAGAPPLIAGDYLSRSTDFARFDVPVEDLRSWGAPFGKIVVFTVGGREYLLGLHARSGGGVTAFELGCTERIELIVNGLDGETGDRAARFVYVASPQAGFETDDPAIDDPACDAATYRLADQSGRSLDK